MALANCVQLVIEKDVSFIQMVKANESHRNVQMKTNVVYLVITKVFDVFFYCGVNQIFLENDKSVFAF